MLRRRTCRRSKYEALAEIKLRTKENIRAELGFEPRTSYKLIDPKQEFFHCKLSANIKWNLIELGNRPELPSQHIITEPSLVILI